MDAVYAVMAARVAEEEQTQRTMIALNEMKPSYPGKQHEEVKTVLDEVNKISQQKLMEILCDQLKHSVLKLTDILTRCFSHPQGQKFKLFEPMDAAFTKLVCYAANIDL